jgi:hypothetical protein
MQIEYYDYNVYTECFSFVHCLQYKRTERIECSSCVQIEYYNCNVCIRM